MKLIRKVAVFNCLISKMESNIDDWLKEENIKIIQINSIADIADDRYMTVTILYEELPNEILKSEESKVLRRPQVEKMTGLSRSTIYLMIKKGTFPKPINIAGGRAVGWLKTTIQDWIAERTFK